MNILIIKLGAVGDVIRTTSILLGLKERYKSCRIDWVTKKEAFDALKNNELIDNAFLMDKNLKLTDKRYGLVVSLDDDYEACKLATIVNSKKIVGAYLENNQRSYTKNSALWFDMGLISKFGKQKADSLKAKNRKTHQEIMYRILGISYKKQEPILVLDKKSLNFAKRFAQNNKIQKSDVVIGINTGAGGRWKDKKLSIQKTAELIDRLNKQISNAKLLLFGGPKEIERNKGIKKLIKTKIIDAGCNNPIMEFASLVNLCNVLVTSDSLALHIGTALKKKVVCFFAPTSPNEIELYSRGIKILPKRGCICCYKPKCEVPPEWDIDKMVKSVKKLT